jgi:peptidoglycan/xylan/chitin deacetylase (PgdA/CDA1 family)
MSRIAAYGLTVAGLLLAAGCLAGPLPSAPLLLPLAGGAMIANPAALRPEAQPTGARPQLSAVQAPAGPTPGAVTRSEAQALLPGIPPLVTRPPTAAPTQAASLAAAALPTQAPTQAPTPAPSQAPAGRVPILEYHYNSFEMLPTVEMRPQWFEAQMRWLALAGFHSLSSAELAGFVQGRQAVPSRSVAITFDVGASHFDQYSNQIIPLLRRYHLRAIFFVMPNQTRAACDGKTTCWPNLLAWRDEGLISIESHSYMHEDYATLGPDELAFDITRSKADIEAHTGQPVLGLCYPFDSLAPAAVALLAKAGYQYAAAGDVRPDRSAEWNDPQPLALPRYYPYSGETNYPIISGSGGQTFDQMLMAASEAA